jgi:hypothetical protein
MEAIVRGEYVFRIFRINWEQLISIFSRQFKKNRIEHSIERYIIY